MVRVGRRVRVDRERLWESLDRARVARGLSWSELASEVGTSASTFTRLRKGLGTDADTFAAILAWLNSDLGAFVHGATVDSKFIDELPMLRSYVRSNAPLNESERRMVDAVALATIRGMRETAPARHSSRRSALRRPPSA